MSPTNRPAYWIPHPEPKPKPLEDTKPTDIVSSQWNIIKEIINRHPKSCNFQTEKI